MVLDTARPKYKENTTWPGMRGRDAVRNSTSKVNILLVFTIDFSEIQFIVNDNSQSVGPKGTQMIARITVSFCRQSSQKWAYETSICLQSRCLDEKLLTPRIRRTN